MRKYLCLILSILFLCSVVKDGKAQIVTEKIPNIGEDISTVITKGQKKAQNLLDKAGNLTVVKAIGKGFNETKTWINTNMKNLQTYAKGVKDKVDQAKAAYDKASDFYEDTVGAYQEIYSDISNLESSYESINNKINEVTNDFNQQIAAEKAVLEGQKNTIIDNMSELEKLMAENPENEENLQKQYDELALEKEEIEKQIKKLDEEAYKELSVLTAPYKEELSKIKNDIDKLKATLMQIAGVQEEVPAEDALLETTDTYFLQYDEELNPKRQDQIRRNRFRERRKSIIEAYTNAVKYIPQANDKNFNGEDLGYGASTFDTTAGAWGANAQLSVEYLKTLSDYAHLLVYDLKRQTAIEIAKIRYYKLEKEQKNITEFNFDDYVFEAKGDK